MISEEAARGLEDRFLSAFEIAQHAYEDIVASKAWEALGYDTFTEWWTAKVVPKMRALDMRPMKEVAKDAVNRIVDDQETLPKTQRLLQREVGELTGLSRRRVGELISSRSGQGRERPGDDLDGGSRPVTASDIDWPQAVAMARDGMSFGSIARQLGVNESTIRRDMNVRRAKAKYDPTFVPDENMTVRHHEASIACEVEPFGDLLIEIRNVLQRATSGRLYTLSARDKQRLVKTVVDIICCNDELKTILQEMFREEA